MEYKILSHHSYTGLAADVSYHLRQGWKLYGNLVIDKDQFYQTITKGL